MALLEIGRAPRVAPLIALAACATLASASDEPTNCAWRVCLERSASARGLSYRIRNRESVPATVTLTFRLLENVRVRQELPIVRTVPPHSNVLVASLDKVTEDRTQDAVPVLQVDLGSDGTVHDDTYLYSMPFGGTEPRELTQGYGGRESHMDGMRYSLDFAMPEGTPVLAAREGSVLHVQDGFTEGGVRLELLDKANIVVIAHPDGTMASYGHLRAGVAVEVGEPVQVGSLLGYSGATGLAGQPHLHFHVGRRLLGDPGRTLQVRFGDGGGGIVELVVGSRYPPSIPTGL